MNKRLVFHVLALTAFVATAVAARAEDDAGAQVLFNKMLAAQDAKDYETFLANADDQLRGSLTRDAFEKSTEVLESDAAGGTREVTFLGELNQRGYAIYLYRLRFKAGDLLGTMTLDPDGRVAGFWLK
jgi:hypothetical protein